MDVIAMISNLAAATKEFFGFQSRRSDLKNAEDVQRAQRAQNEIKANDAIKTTIAKRDVEQTRNDLAE